MHRLLAALALALTALPVAAQTSDDAFQQRAFDTAASAGDSRVPVLCGGLYEALTLALAGDAESIAQFNERQEVARNIATVVYMLETQGQGVDLPEAEAFVEASFVAVGAVFQDWFLFNQTNGQDPITERIANNYGFCETQYVDWTTTPEGN